MGDGHATDRDGLMRRHLPHAYGLVARHGDEALPTLVVRQRLYVRRVMSGLDAEHRRARHLARFDTLRHQYQYPRAHRPPELRCDAHYAMDTAAFPRHG